MKQGGSILNGRLAGNLLITRSLGDFDFKKYGLSSSPDIRELDLGEGELFVIASDGVWDVLDKEWFAKLGVEGTPASLKKTARRVVDQAIQLGSTDNISIILVKW